MEDCCVWKYIAFPNIRGVLRPWFGGPCPYPEGAIGSVMFRDGERHHGIDMNGYRWNNNGFNTDIIECIWLYGGEG